jgi:hypothetical protein
LFAAPGIRLALWIWKPVEMAVRSSMYEVGAAVLSHLL